MAANLLKKLTKQEIKKFEKIRDSIITDQYERRLLEKVFNAFEWEGVENLDTRTINYQLFTRGVAGVIKDRNKYVTIICNEGGRPNSLGYGDLIVGVDYSARIKIDGYAYYGDEWSDRDLCVGVMCFNDTYKQGIMDIVERYARLLQVADKSIEIAMLNTRVLPVIPAPTQNAKNQIQAVLDQIYDGRPHAYYDEGILSGLSENGLNELLTDIRKSANMLELIEMRADIYSRFCIEIGIPLVNNTKRSQLISGEIGGISTLSLINLKNMLQMREEFCERFNSFYGENLSVKISDEFLLENGEMLGGEIMDDNPAEVKEAKEVEDNESI